MIVRIAKSLDGLRSECNEYAPHRSKIKDGWIGDASHAARDSRHNPNAFGTVTAVDITHDPDHGMDTYKLARLLTQNPHPDLYYIISNHQAAYRSSGWVWREYLGADPHTGHMHVAVGRGPDSNPVGPYDDTIPWNVRSLMESNIQTSTGLLYSWMDRVIFKPRGSELSGEIIRQMEQSYGLKPIWILVVTGAETACGRRTLVDDPSKPQRIVTEAHNYGCIKYGSLVTKWGQLAVPNKPFVTSDGRQFFTFPSIWAGATALGRLMKVGPPGDVGGYLKMFKVRDWYSFSRVYYGKDVPGVDAYYDNLLKIEAGFKAKAKSEGFIL